MTVVRAVIGLLLRINSLACRKFVVKRKMFKLLAHPGVSRQAKRQTTQTAPRQRSDETFLEANVPRRNDKR